MEGQSKYHFLGQIWPQSSSLDNLLPKNLKMKVVTFENALKNFLLDFVYFLLYTSRAAENVFNSYSQSLATESFASLVWVNRSFKFPNFNPTPNRIYVFTHKHLDPTSTNRNQANVSLAAIDLELFQIFEQTKLRTYHYNFPEKQQ